MTVPISIVIVTYNGWHCLEPCLESILPQLSPADEIIIVDNGSTDATRQELSAINDSRIHCTSLDSNLGFAAANNLGVRMARCEWLLLLNNDTIASAGLLAALRRTALNNPEYRIFTCKMIRLSDQRIDNVGIAVTSPLLRQIQIAAGSDAESHRTLKEVFGASGGAMLVHHSVVGDIGLFDQRFFAYCEDVDFALRARLAGYRCSFVPNAVVFHKQSATGSKMPALRLYYIQRNMELALFRNFPLGTFVLYLPLHAAYSLFQVARWSLRGHGFRVLKAKVDAVRLWSAMRASRGPIRIRAGAFRSLLHGHFRIEQKSAAAPAAESTQEQPV